MFATFNRFDIQMTLAQARTCDHPGPADADVEALLQLPHIKRQLTRISDADLVAELSEYGAWDDAELADRSANERRIIWIAACDISEGKS